MLIFLITARLYTNLFQKIIDCYPVRSTFDQESLSKGALAEHFDLFVGLKLTLVTSVLVFWVLIFILRLRDFTVLIQRIVFHD
jgi:hypothetical protein